MQPEPDAEAEPEYDYTKTVPPNMQPEPDAEAEPEYDYTKTVPPGEPPEPDAETKPEYVYKKTVPPGEQSGPAPETEHEYSFASPELPHGMAMRIADLKKRMDAIYGTDHRNFAEKWRRAFADYPYPRDLRDIRAVWEIFTAIEPMSRLNGATWDILQTELFRYREDTASWHLLQERFDAVRRSYVAPAQTPVRTPPKKTSVTEFCAILLIIVILIGLLILIQDKAQELKQRQKLQEYQQMISEQIQLENPTIPISRGILQNVYTKEFPCEMDLNQDEIPDHMYYDSNEGLFMVELYITSTGTYNLYGSVDQYLEENPEMDSIKGLSYFTCGGKSLR
ncbi:MAG: procyclic acidic repetitive family protein [Acetatifactor sp.]|nr:procyclic acidic repetitive family protein [Acetatifactor sp.]